MINRWRKNKSVNIFITCVVIVFALAIVVLMDFSRDHRSSETMAQSHVADVQVSSATINGEVVGQAVAAPFAEGIPENLAERRAEKTELSAASFDVLQVYDALLLLNFSDDDGLLVDRNTLAALQAIYRALGPHAGTDAFTRLQGLLEEALPSPVAGQLLEMTRQYFSYRQAEQDVRNAAVQQSDDPMHSYHQLVALRRNYLGEETAGRLFVEEETQLPYMTSAFAVARDNNLSDEERAARLAELQEAFNRSASRMESPLARQVLEARVARLRAEGAGEAEIFAVREEVLGSAGAQKLAEEDRDGESRAVEPGSTE